MKLNSFGLTAPKKPYNFVLVGDFLKDLDDEHSLCGIAGLSSLGFVNLRCVIGNLAPAELRARGAKGTLKTLGLNHVPVGAGLPVFVGKLHPYETNLSYLADISEVWLDGEDLLVRTLSTCPDGSVILILQSGLTDSAKLLAEHQKLFTAKVAKVAIMGGVETEGNEAKLGPDGLMTPNNSNNNSFDMPAAVWLYRQLQILGIPMIITTREVPYAAQVPFAAYDRFEETGNPVGKCLKDRQLPSMQHLWEAACSPAGSTIRGTLPADRDREWFIRVYCNGVEPKIGEGESIWPFVGCFNLYDPANVYAAIPELAERFLEPYTVSVLGTKHVVYGVSKTVHGVKDPTEFARFMVEIELSGLEE